MRSVLEKMLRFFFDSQTILFSLNTLLNVDVYSYNRLCEQYKEIRLILGLGVLSVYDEANFHTMNSWEALKDLLLSIGKKGLYIQRYKGLGEMNPEQLWETTLDPEIRTLKRVSIEDAIESDSMFSMLMGDLVAPRRQFIEENALKVKNLDV